MDGLAEDADVVFLLTTNRADVLEPALAARPGRVDQAVELACRTPTARRALFELYRGRLELDAAHLDAPAARTEGVTASFLKELLRRSALIAATRRSGDGAGDGPEHGPRGHRARHGAPSRSCCDTRNAMTRVLLGGSGRRVTTPAGGRDGTPGRSTRRAGRPGGSADLDGDAGRRVQHLDVAVDVAPHTELVAGEPQTADRQCPERRRSLRSQHGAGPPARPPRSRAPPTAGPPRTRRTTPAGGTSAGYGAGRPSVPASPPYSSGSR